MTEKKGHLPRLLRPEPGEGSGRAAITAIAIARVGAPALIAVAGVVLLAVGLVALGAVLIGVALLVVLIDWFARLSLRSENDLQQDEAARREFTRTGHWPDDDSSPASGDAPDPTGAGDAT